VGQAELTEITLSDANHGLRTSTSLSPTSVPARRGSWKASFVDVYQPCHNVPTSRHRIDVIFDTTGVTGMILAGLLSGCESVVILTYNEPGSALGGWER